MGRRLFAVLAAVGMTAGLLQSGATAQEGGGRYPPLPLDPEGRIDPDLRASLGDPDRTVTVVLQLPGPPVAVVEAAQGDDFRAAAAADAVRSRLQDTQGALVDDVAAAGGTVLAQYQDAYNGMKVTAKAGDVARLAALPGVEAVHGLTLHRPHLVDAVPLIGAPQVWEDLGLTGRDVSIAVIDTGIDYLHAAFGGPGDPASYEANDPTVVEPGSFPTAKVVGGWDFVGDDFDARSDDPALNTPRPDGDPIDCDGHGSHVAGIAAGAGVRPDGTTFSGPYDTTTPTEPFLVAPGVAPEATLYALRVFGCAGSTNVTIDAINWAVAHDVDVINLSLGSDFGAANDPASVAANNAALAGVIVVASSGNAGSAPYITGAPGAGSAVISVAAVDAIASIPAAALTVEGADPLTLQNSNGAPISDPITAPVHVLTDDPGTDTDESLGCEPTDYAGMPAGAIVVTVRDVCDRVARAILGQEAGAAAVIMINSTEGFPPVEGPIEGVDIPFLGARLEDADALRALDGETATVTVTDPLPNPTFRQPAGFTSAGPLGGTSAVKPDIAAPGVSIASVAAGTGTGSARFSGTSQAAPFVAGVAALVRQARPDWTVEAVKAAIVNTGDPTGIEGYETTVVGSGLVDALAAATTTAVAVGDPMTASLSFGLLQDAESIAATRYVTVWNHGEEPVSFDVGVEVSTDATGAGAVQVSPETVVIEPHSTQRVAVELRVDATTVPQDLQTVSGNIALVPSEAQAGATELRVPYVAVVRGVSELDTSPEVVILPRQADTVFFTTTNASAVPGTVDAFAWQLWDGAGEQTSADIRAAGVQLLEAGDEGAPTAAFAIHTSTADANPAAHEWSVLVDVDEDDVDDYLVLGADVGVTLVGSGNGELGSFTVDLATGELVNAFAVPPTFNTSTIVLPFRSADLGLEPDGDSDFEYTVTVERPDLDDELPFDEDTVDGQASFDIADPPVQTGQSLTAPPEGQAQWTAAVDREQLREHPVLGWLVSYPTDETGGASADLIPLLAPTPAEPRPHGGRDAVGSASPSR